jgi:hypothetical protein
MTKQQEIEKDAQELPEECRANYIATRVRLSALSHSELISDNEAFIKSIGK